MAGVPKNHIPGLHACLLKWRALTFEQRLLDRCRMVLPKAGKYRRTAVVFVGLLCLIFSSSPAADIWGQIPGARIHPVLRLEKARYLLGESIRFWVGVEIEPPGINPRQQRKTCSLEITKPDGRVEVQSVGWPLDGDLSRGWLGGWGFAAESPGGYSLALECEGESTQRLPLIVEKNEISNQVTASFRFEKSGPIKMGDPIPVVFRVTNDSPFPIRFPQRGVMMEGVSLSVVRDKPAYRSDFFYPWEKLRQFPLSPDTYTWDVAAKLPSITVEPGKRFEQRLTLNDAYEFEQPGNYAVTFSTVVSVPVGDQDGPLADLCPIRVAADKTEVFYVSEHGP
jgi:hypothetical protein